MLWMCYVRHSQARRYEYCNCEVRIAERKQTGQVLCLLTSEVIVIQSVSQGPISLIIKICTEARAVTLGTIKIPSKSAAEFTQLRQPNYQISVGMCMVAHCKLCNKHPRKTRDFGALRLRPFNEIEISIDDIFENVSFS